ncbi:MAG: McrC family protein [Gammaproteobacteria bacterium]|nr:McrC family protein [Gammaproteobacteria bacterium]
MPRTITLREYESLGVHGGEGKQKISERALKEIRAYVQDNPDPESNWVMRVTSRTVTAKNYVGVIQTRDGTTIEILPKVDLDGGEDTDRERDIFLKMLRHYRDGPCRNLNDADIRAIKNFPILEAFIAMFLKDMRELTRRGLACAYGEVEENRHYLKGKLMMAQHLRHNLVHRERFYVRYEIFSPNRPVNRLLKSALQLLLRASRKEENRAQIRNALFYFEDIPPSTDVDTDLIRARVDRTMPLYNRLFPWARLFLKRAAPATWRDNNPALALLFPMQDIFEDYVAHMIARAAPPNWNVKAQERKYYLIERSVTEQGENREVKLFNLRPDIVARDGDDKKIWIMDTKWKRLNARKDNHDITPGDMYQLYAYGKKCQEKCPGAEVQLYLLYPENEDFTEKVTYCYDPKLQLTVFPVKLSCKDAVIINHLQKLFASVMQCEQAA